MNSTTLRGIFPGPKPIHRKNFVRENIKNLKEMDSFMQEKGSKAGAKKEPHRPVSYSQVKNPLYKNKITHTGVQTERPEDVKKTGTLRSPSPSTLLKTNRTSHRSPERGDTVPEVTKNLKKLDFEEKQNFIKQNIKSIKPNKQKQEPCDPLLAPATYQKGVVPKYLKEKLPKENITKPTEFEGEVVDGLVALPDDERKEYLRVARENYAGLIKELNTMPVSNDTLKKRKRKMEIETELKRLDEVIKIFQKPKVFVKAD